jgi:hypothetical protein
MIERIGLVAHWLDAWLREHMGRAYTATLGVGLVIGIIATLDGLGAAVHSGVSVFKIAGVVLFQTGLLINQLAQFHDYRQERRQRRAARKGKPTDG